MKLINTSNYEEKKKLLRPAKLSDLIRKNKLLFLNEKKLIIFICPKATFLQLKLAKGKSKKLLKKFLFYLEQNGNN